MDKTNIRKKLEKLESQKNEINIKIGKLIRPYIPNMKRHTPIRELKNISDGIAYEWFPISTFWHCDKSPIDCCMYNHNEDYAHDQCLFCGEPEERK